MTNKYSNASLERLGTCHPDLQRLFFAVLETTDHSILEGHRDQAKQNKYYKTGKSRLPWPRGKHNKLPSEAVDAVPYPVPDWNDAQAFHSFAGKVLAKAKELKIRIRWGGDWNMNGKTEDETFRDLVHFELITPLVPFK